MPLPTYTRAEIVAALKDSGLGPGDTAFVSTSLGMLGIAEGAKSMDDICEMVLSALLEVVGESGTILAPAYSYTIGRSMASEPALFDVAQTDAEIGPFPNYLRQQKNAERSHDPMMSITGIGPACKTLFRDIPATSYGADSVFARMVDWPQMKCVSIGLGPNWTAFIHYLDWLAQVPFRYDKLFCGRTKAPNGDVSDTYWVYSVQPRIDNTVGDAHRLAKMAEDAGIWNHAPLGRARVYVAGYREYFEFAKTKIADDPWLMAAGPACDILEEEDRRVGKAPIAVDAQAPRLAETIWALPRGTVSDVMESCFHALHERTGARLSRFRSGHNAFDWIVPEKWRCDAAHIRCVESGESWSLQNGSLGVQFSSQPVSTTVDGARLERHMKSRDAAASAIPWSEDFNNRDWAFCVPQDLRGKLSGDRYEVEIAALSSFGEMFTGDLHLPGDKPGCVLIAAYTGGRWAGQEMLTGLEAALELSEMARGGNLRGVPDIRILFLPGPVGLAAWLAANPEIAQDPATLGMLHLRNLAAVGSFALHHANSAQSSLLRAARNGVLAAGGASSQESPWFDPLASGRNPVAEKKLRDVAMPHLVLGRSAAAPNAPLPFSEFRTNADRLPNNGAKDTVALLQNILADL